MNKFYTMIGLVLLGTTAFAQTALHKQPHYANGILVLSANGAGVATPSAQPVLNANRGLGPCITAADTYVDLGGAPCFDGTECIPADAGFSANVGVYGSEAYTLTNVQAGFEYVFDMCTGAGAGAWIPEIAIVGPDGTTVDAHNAASAASGQTHAEQCTITWTASLSGDYTIVIHEMGTAAGNAPAQADCETTLAVNNGNPTVECGTNAAACPVAGPCVAGVVDASVSPATLCPGDTVTFATDGAESGDGGFGFAVRPEAGATGGNNGQAITITGVTFPTTLDSDLGGVLSANALPNLVGTWTFFQLSFDAADEPCAVSADSIVVTFLPASDPSCPAGISEQTLNLNLYPNPTTGAIRVEMTGDNTNATISVVDITGRMVYSEKVNISSNFKKDIQLNVENGNYIISVVDETSVVTRKIQVLK